MQIEITEKGFDVPNVVIGTNHIALQSTFGRGIFTGQVGKGYAYWRNEYSFAKDTILEARADQPVLELHIARRGIWKGAWEGIEHLEVSPWQFNLTYTPHVKTSALFRQNKVYQSCDLHFDFDYLAELTVDFPALDQFLWAVTHQCAANLSDRNHACTREMMGLVNVVFGTGPVLTAMQVRQLLIAALEKVAIDTDRPLPMITKRQEEGLRYAKALIEGWGDSPLSLKELAVQCGLNEYMLKSGFQRLFQLSPYAYHVELKMKQAKMLLLDTRMAISTIAYQLGYSQSSSFGHEFKKAVGMSPAEFRKSEKV